MFRCLRAKDLSASPRTNLTTGRVRDPGLCSVNGFRVVQDIWVKHRCYQDILRYTLENSQDCTRNSYISHQSSSEVLATSLLTINGALAFLIADNAPGMTVDGAADGPADGRASRDRDETLQLSLCPCHDQDHGLDVMV